MEEKKIENKEKQKEEKKLDTTKKEVKKKTEVKKEKKNKKAPWIITSVTILVVALVVVLLTYMIVTSSNPKKSIDGLLMNLREGEFEKAREFVNSDDFSTSGILDENLNQEAQKLLFDKLSWKVLKVTENGNEATIEMEITNKDFKTILGNVMQKTFKAAFSDNAELDNTEETAQNYLIEELKNDQVQTTTVTKTIKAVKQDKKWKIDVDDELLYTLLPGLQETINSLS